MTAVTIAIILLVVLLIRLASGGMDGDRVRETITNKGGKVISQEWVPFGKGWVGEKNDRIYQIVYLDKDGNKHKAFVKTSMFSGVYFSDDEIIEYNSEKMTSHNEESKDLIAENERLRRELEELRNKQK